MTISETVRKGAEILGKAGASEAENDARELMLYLRNWNLTEYLMNVHEILTDSEAASYRELIGKRAERVPLQHLTGRAYFYGYEFLVNPSVLIPRFDTEILVGTVLAENTGHQEKLSVLDLCTGSGCIAVTLKKEGGYGQVDASDIDPAALHVAEMNAKRLGAEIRFLTGDLFAAIPAGSGIRYDLIVCNPPYIGESERDSLDPEVRDHDPEKALFAGADGLDFYRRISEEAPKYLKPGGKIYLEIGYTQAEAVSLLLFQNGFSGIRTVQDLSGKDRVVRADLLQETEK